MTRVMLCQKMTLDEFKVVANDEWIVERKFDGIRAFVKQGKLYDRKGADITHKFPEFNVQSIADEWVDGEIVASSGVFEDVSGRIHLKDKFTISLAAKKNPARFVVFDVIKPIMSLKMRKDYLELISSVLPPNFDVAAYGSAEMVDVWWSRVTSEGWEGLVAKRLTAEYRFERSPSCLKIKAFVEVEHKFTKYEVHPRGITIEDEEGRRVVINGSEAKKVVDIFKKDGCVVAQIQYLPQRSGVWRFPSYRGVKQ